MTSVDDDTDLPPAHPTTTHNQQPHNQPWPLPHLAHAVIHDGEVLPGGVVDRDLDPGHRAVHAFRREVGPERRVLCSDVVRLDVVAQASSQNKV